MLNRMWKIPACRNMYVTGCHTCRRPKMSAGRRPNINVIAGTTSEMTKATTLAMTIALIAGVSGPGPKEYASVEDEGYRDRILIQSVPTTLHSATATSMPLNRPASGRARSLRETPESAVYGRYRQVQEEQR